MRGLNKLLRRVRRWISWAGNWCAASTIVAASVAQAAPLSVAVDWTYAKQEIDGFGASSAWYASDLLNMPDPARTQIVDLLFSQSTGAGLSILRNRVPFEISPSQGVYDWTKDAGAVWLMGQAKQRGAARFLSTPWTPPGYMKTNGSPFNGGQLKSTHYQSYADYLSRYVREYKSRYGLDIYAISVQNEPELTTDYESCTWTAAQFRTFIRDYLRPTFTRDGVKAKVVAAESNVWYEGLIQDTLADSAARSGLDIVAAHPYFPGVYNTGYDVFPYTKTYGKRLWATEVSMAESDDIDDALRWARLIHQHMTIPESNAFLFWWGASGKSGAGEDLITFDANTGGYAVHKRLHAFANFSRFIRPGYKRIDATPQSSAGVHITAFKDDMAGKLVLVAINERTDAAAIDMGLYGFSAASTAAAYRTSATEGMAPLAAVAVSAGRLPVTLAPRSITTFVVSGSASIGAPGTAVFVDTLNNLSNVHAASGSLTKAFTVNTGDAETTYQTDDDRLVRQANTDEWLVYKKPNMQRFELTVFYNDSEAGGSLVLKGSSTGSVYSVLRTSKSAPVALPGYWYKVVYSVAGPDMPVGTQYLRVEIPRNTKAAWTPQLGEVRITYSR